MRNITIRHTFISLLLVAGLFVVPVAARATEAGYSQTDPSIFSSKQHASPWFDRGNVLGSFIYHYPIDLPPGRLGVEPLLELTYNSFSTDVASVAGYGWSLSVPYIQVVNKTGVEDLYDSTFFTSSLSGELKSVSLSDSMHGTYGAQVETDAYGTYTFETDGSWTMVDARGVTYTFGSSSDAQVVDPSDSTRVYRWMLEEIRDQNDNYARFTYTEDGGQVYPLTISYTGNGTTDGMFLATFTYESRSDASTSYASGFVVETTQRLSDITVAVGSDTRHAYALTYRAGDNGVRSLLASIAHTAYGVDSVATALPETTFDYSTSTLSWTQNSAYSIPKCFAQNEGYDCATRVSDVDGDALPDLLYAPGDPTASAYVYLNDGDGTGWSSDASYTIPVRFMSGMVSSAKGVELFDVNGDGLDDFVHGESDDIYDGDGDADRDVYVNIGDGTGWTQDTSYALPIDFVRNSEPYSMYDKFVRLGDVNGDGLLDLVEDESAYSTSGAVYYNDGDGTGWTQATTYSAISGNFNYTFGGDSRDGGARLVDVNNDGLADIVESMINVGYSSAVYLNDGDGTGWTQDTSYWVPAYFSYGGYDGGVRLTDANGDGLIDMVVAEDVYDTNAIYLNTGDDEGWTLASGSMPEEFTLYNLNANPYDRGVRLMDVDGDGLVDIARSDNTVSSGGDAVYIHDGEVPDLLTSITTSQGSQIDVSYVASSQTGENPDLPFTVQVVETIATSDGFGSSDTTSWAYADGSFYFEDAQNREFAGFGAITETDALGNVKITYLHQGNGDDSASSESVDDAGKIGKAYRSERYDSAGALYELIVTDWDNTDLGSDRDFVSVTSEVRLQYDGGSTHADTASAYTYDTDSGVLLTQVEYGEVSASSDGAFSDTGSDDRTTTFVYAVDASGVITSLPATVTVTDTDGATISETRYTYDGLAFGSVEIGNVTQEEVWISESDYAAIAYTYDAYGNMLTQTDPFGNTTTTGYDSYNLYPSIVTNALSQAQTFEYDLASGKPTHVVDVSGSIIETDYDGLDRPTEERRSSDASATALVTTKTWSYYDDTTYYPDAPRSVKLREYLSETLYKETINYLDGLDRIVETKILDAAHTGYNESETTYDALGRVSSTTLAKTAAGYEYDVGTVSSDLSETYTYDALNRATEVTNVLGATSTTYDGFTKTVTDAIGNEKDYETDGLGRLVSIVEYLDSIAHTTNYTWDAADHLTSLEDAMGNVRHFTFDGRGLRLTAEDLHDSADTTYGTWVYIYDDAGNLETSLSPNGVTVTYGYDELNRQTDEDADDASGTEVSYTYDACTGGTGKLCEAVVNGGSTTIYTYDSAGNTASETVTIDSTAYTTSYTYDRQGNVLTTTHPDGSVVTNTYNAIGKIETIDGVVTDTDYGPHGEVTSQTNENGVVTTYTYDETQRYRLTSKTTTGYESDGTSTTSTTTTSFYPTAGDGYVYKANASWDTAHDATMGSIAYPTSTSGQTGIRKSPTTYYIYRTFLPFDTSSIPDDAVIISATLNVYASSKTNNDNDGDDFVTVVQTSQASTTALSIADFDQAGAINNPIEGIDTAQRKDITSITTGAYLTFNLNATGLGWISNTGTTKLGLREGHDVIDSVFTSASTTSSQYNYLYIRFSEYTGATYDPYLSVTYTQTSTSSTPLASTLQDLSYTYDAVGNITQIVDASDVDSAKTTDYAYDDLYRLTSATVSGAADGDNGTITYTYDAIGNITSRSDVGAYAYDGDTGSSYANPHTVTSILNTDGSTITYSYDNNGNLTSDSSTGLEPSMTYAWDYKNRLASSSESTTTSSTTTTTTSTTVSFYPTTGDGFISKADASWDAAHDATSGSGASATSSTYILTGDAKSSTNYSIYRSFLPFDTSSIPDDATVTSASLNVYPYQKSNHDNDGDDFVTVVQTSQASVTALSTADFDQAGAINNPTEGIDTAQRKDITSITTGAYLTFNLNSTGLGWISNTGVTKLGLREGHDVIDSAFTSSSATYSRYNYLYIRPGEYTGTSNDPYLTVTYTQPTTITTTITTTETTTYAYDHAMRRVFKTSDSGTTYYPTGDYSVTDGVSTTYVTGSSGLAASIETDPSTSSGSPSSTSTIHTDHLGSTSVVTDEDGIMIELLDYNPYGTQRISWSPSSADGSAQSQKTYIGEYSDNETGLSYLNARYYDPGRGQFLGQDPVFLNLGIGDVEALNVLSDPQILNSYTYARGNPIGFIDRDGNTPTIPASNYVPSYWDYLKLSGFNPGTAAILFMTYQGVAHDIETVSDSEQSGASRLWAGISLGLNIVPGGAAEKGTWITTKEVMSGPASAYQALISRVSSAYSYLLNGVKFDGFRGGVLFDAKSGMQNFVDATTGTFKSWFKESGGQSLIQQAERQIQAAEGDSIEWHFQYKEVQDAVGNLFKENNIKGIDLIHSPD